MTWEDPRELLPLHLAALEFALDEVGVTEESANWSDRIADYLAAAGFDVPAPWCAAFVNWCAEQAAELLGEDILSPLEEIPLQGFVQSYFEYSQGQGWIISAEEAGPGDLFVLWYDSLDRYGHVGFVQEVDEDAGVFYTVEGNTNAEGSREGVWVAEKERPLTDNVKFLRWDWRD